MFLSKFFYSPVIDQMNQTNISRSFNTSIPNLSPKFASILQAIFLFLIAPIPFQAMAANLTASELTLWWCVPFAGILLSIALCPLLIPKIWHKHTGKIILAWIIILLCPLYWQYGINISLHTVIHALLHEYLPFMLLLMALYAISGGIVIKLNASGSTGLNILLLTIGTLFAGIMGTTGASMLLIRPLLRANANRCHQAHVVIFFILLVGNIGGGLTPLGDPPLFLGFLKGVDFLWTIQHMLLPVLFNSLFLLILFYFVDRFYWCREPKKMNKTVNNNNSWQLYGKLNLVLLLAVISVVLLSGLSNNQTVWLFYGIELHLVALVRDGLLAIITLVAIFCTSSSLHQQNEFSWAPIQEVGKLFAGIFITISPVMLMLQAGATGYFHPLVSLLQQQGNPDNPRYFWLSGVLSSFLDNAPTYLVFFNLAGGDAQLLMHQFDATLLAISMGSVFMGALTYIGNAPNLMVKAIAEQQSVRMPGFFAYMGWSFSLLIPLLMLDTLLFI